MCFVFAMKMVDNLMKNFSTGKATVNYPSLSNSESINRVTTRMLCNLSIGQCIYQQSNQKIPSDSYSSPIASAPPTFSYNSVENFTYNLFEIVPEINNNNNNNKISNNSNNYNIFNNMNNKTITDTLLGSIVATTASAAAAETEKSKSYLGLNETYWEIDEDFDFLYRHSVLMTVVYCIAYIIVFIVGLVGNSFVIAVVLRAPRMRTVTNYFIVNLAIADILVIVFCLPATLMSNIFVRKYFKSSIIT